MSSLQEALGLVDEVYKELSFYDAGAYKQTQEQTALNRAKDLLDRVRTGIMAQDPDGRWRFELLSSNDWRRLANLVGPLARCFTTTGPQTYTTPSAKTRHASATAVSTLALISSCHQKAKVILTSAVDTGVVAAIVQTLRQSLRNPVADRVVRAMLYKLIDALMGLTLYASTQHQQLLVQNEVVDVCLELVTSSSLVEPESKLLASKTLYNCLVTPGKVVTALRQSKVTALNAQLQQLAYQVPDPPAAASLALSGTGGGGAAKSISMPVLLPAIMSWIWFLPDYIVDHLQESLITVLNRVVALVWPEGCPGLPLVDSARDEAPPVGPLQVAQLSLPNRALRQTFQNLITAIATTAADVRLRRILRGSRVPDPPPDQPGFHTALPARLVRVVMEGRPDGVETKVALELLADLFGCDASAPELADDTLAAGLLRAMSDLGVFPAMRTETGLQGLSAYVKIAVKLVKRAAEVEGLSARLRESGVPASVAYIAFWPGGKLSLKLEALQALHHMVQLDAEMADAVVAMPNFPIALANALLGGDPDTRKATKKSGGGGGKKKSGAAAAASAAAAAPSAAEAMNQAARNIRDQMQEAAFDILAVVLIVARDSDKVWHTVVESAMLPRLLQHSPAFPMRPELLAEVLATVGLTFTEHRHDVVSVGALQAACAPHVLPLLVHEDGVVAEAAARLLLAIVEDMVRYQGSAADVEQGDEILKALVVAGPAIDTADAVAAAVAARAAVAAAAAKPEGAEQRRQEAGPTAGRAAGPASAAAGEGTGPAPAPAVMASTTAAETTAGAAAAAALKTEPGASGGTAGAGGAAAAPSVARPDGRGEPNGGGGGGVPMEVDVPASTTAAGAATAAAAGTAAGATGAEGAAAAAAAAAPEEVSELVDVTAQGLGILCTALQTLVAAVLQRPRTSSPASPEAAAAGAAAAGTTASSPAPKSPAPAPAGAQPPPPPLSEISTCQLLEVLLRCCTILSKASQHMPQHSAVRRHLARAFAYARPPAEELAAALLAQPTDQALPEQKHLLEVAQRAMAALRSIPVLDVSLLPKPKPDDDEEAREAAAPPAGAPPRKGRPPGSGNKRASQNSLAPDGAGQPLSQQPSKRQRTAAAAAAAAADADGPTMTRSRSSNMAAEARNGDAAAGAVGSPRVPGGRRETAPAAVASPSPAPAPAPAAAVAAGAPNGVLGQHLPRSQPSASAAGQDAEGPAPQEERGSRAERAGSVAAGAGGGGGVPRAAAADGPSAAPATSGGGVRGARNADAAPAGPVSSGQPRPVHAPTPGVSTAARGLTESPSVSVERGTSQPWGAGTAAATAAAAAAAGPGAGAGGGAFAAGVGGGGGAGGGGGGRVSVADFKAKFLDLKKENNQLSADLEAQRKATAEAEARYRTAAASLTSRTQEVEKLLAELEKYEEELAVAAAAAEAAQLEAQRARLEAQGLAARVNQLEAGNARLQQELDQLNEIELE